MEKKKIFAIVGVLVAVGIGAYLMSRRKPSRKMGAGSHGGSGGDLIGGVAKVIPFGIDGSSGEEDYDGTIYDALFKRQPNINSRLESKVPQGIDITYDILDQDGDWVYLFSDINHDDIYTGWAKISSIILVN